MSILLASLVCWTAVQHQPRRALWVWHTQSLLQEEKDQESFFKFLEAPKGDPKNRISVIFVSRVGVEDASSFNNLRHFIARAHDQKVRVDYLCGDAEYVLPQKQREGLWQLGYVLKFNRQSPKGCRFDGIQYDVEPYALKGWPAKDIVEDYLTFLDRAHHQIKDSRQKLKLGAAIPRWFDGAELNNLYKSVIDRTDYVAVMDYVDNATHFVEDGANEVAYGTKRGKEVWLGAETSELTDEPRATFFKEGNASMERAFQAAARAFRNRAGFAGVAIEHYEPYRALKP